MKTDAVSYYVSFDNYTVGKLQGQYVIDKLGLKLTDKSKTYNIEFTAGDPADNNAPFFFNGAMDTLKPYIDAGILKVPSTQTAFQTVATAKWDTTTSMTACVSPTCKVKSPKTDNRRLRFLTHAPNVARYFTSP